jgi:hypothetical protein
VRATRYAFPDPEMPGHFVRISPNGATSFAAVTIGADRRQHWITIGKVGVLPIAEACDHLVGHTKSGAQAPPDFVAPAH